VSIEELPAALAAALPGLSDEELQSALDSIRAAMADVDPLTASDETLELLEAIDVVVNGVPVEGEEVPTGILAEQAARAAEVEARADRARELADRINPPAGDEGDPVEGAVDENGEPVVAEVPAEAVDEPPVPIAAASAPARVTRVVARRPASMTPAPAAKPSHKLSLVASANNPAFGQGSELDTEKLAVSVARAFALGQSYRGPATRLSVATINEYPAVEQYGEERTLTRDAEANMGKIRAVTGRQALSASGGICAPPVVRYDLPNLLGTTERPVKNTALARFGADRGAVTTLAPITLADVSGPNGISRWTNETDTTPGSTTKPCLTMTCPADATTEIEAIVRCLQVGNFRARFFPEQIAEWLDHLDVWAAREAERDMLDTIDAGSKQIVTGQVLGTMKDILTVLDRATSQLRNQYRLPDTFPFRWMAPRTLLSNMRADLVRELPNGTLDERFAAADARIESFIRARNVNVTWLLDGQTGQDYGIQGGGALQGFKTSVAHYLFPEGTWLGLDAAGYDFGIVRDSTLNATNNYRIFSETFEQVHFHGVESWQITSAVCPDGSTSGTLDINPCATGS
jgi:hypothetical protein